MKMTVSLYGAAGEVTGSAYHVQTPRASVLVDFGLFQGRGMTMEENRVPRQLHVDKLDAVVLTHAHLDHVGRLPLLTKRGYAKPIYATPASIEVARLILQDAAKVQEQDIARVNRYRAEKDREPLAPLYSSADVSKVLPLFAPLPYEQPFTVAPGVSVRMFEAGHILGSASIEMTLEDSGVKRVVGFSGDLGPRDAPILHDYSRLERGSVVFMESTYGDRDHRPLKETVAEFRELISEAVQRRGKILVPSFAVGRAQTILYHLAEMFEEKVVPSFPVILDSPMAIEATELHRRHPELYDPEMNAVAGEKTFLRNFPNLQHSVTAEESRALNDLPGPCLIMAGAGMCNAGRIMHHLRHNLGHEGTVVMIVGYQAPGSLGRSLIEGAKEVSIFGEPLVVRAKTHSLGGFSAHAAQSDLLYWLSSLAPKYPRVVLTHGEDRGRLPLAALIQQRFRIKPVLPERFDVIEI